MKVRSALLAVAATSLLLVAGCGSDSSDGGSSSTTEAATTTVDGGTSGTAATPDGAPSEAELSQGLQEGLDLPADQADCVAAELPGAGLSEAGLQAVAAADEESLSGEDQAAVAAAVGEALADC